MHDQNFGRSRGNSNPKCKCFANASFCLLLILLGLVLNLVLGRFLFDISGVRVSFDNFLDGDAILITCYNFTLAGSVSFPRVADPALLLLAAQPMRSFYCLY